MLTSPIKSDFQVETLLNCGIRRDRIVPLDRWEAVQARELIVPANLSDISHPAMKAAPWVMDFIRSKVGGERGPSRAGSRIYISRSDAPTRRLLNEDALVAALQPFGFQAVTLSGRTVADQADLFAGADRIIGLHGAGLTNVVFCQPRTRVLEMFTHGYGTCAFWILATNLDLPYATFMMDEPADEAARARNDVTVDVPRFMAAAKDFLQLS